MPSQIHQNTSHPSAIDRPPLKGKLFSLKKFSPVAVRMAREAVNGKFDRRFSYKAFLLRRSPHNMLNLKCSGVEIQFQWFPLNFVGEQIEFLGTIKLF
jgi:hypothetical protein